MAESKPKKSTQNTSKPTKLVDVTPPSQTAAPATARPVIVGHTNSIQKDPMVAPAEPAPNKEVILEKPKKELTLEPATEEVKLPVEKADLGQTEGQDNPEEVTPKEEAAEDTSIEQDPENSEADEPKSSDSGAVDAIVNEVNTQKDRIKQTEAEQKLNEEIQKLATSKKYYVKTRLPANKRNIRWLLVLLLVALLAAAGWYFGAGPGKEYWDKSAPISNATPQPSAVAETPTPAPTPPVSQTETFSKPELGIGFTYPKDWKIETVKDTEFPTRDVITLTSTTETIKTAAKGAPSVDAEVYLRTRIFVENTANPKEYASDLVKMSSCSSEDVVVSNATMRLLFVDLAQEAPNVSQVSLSPDNCIAAGTLFSANDQIQLTSKKNTYIIYAEYVFSGEYLKKQGTTTPDAIALAQESGVVVSKDSFKAGKNFIKFTDLVKSIKEQ